MKFCILILVFVSNYIANSYCNPNLKKGELIEAIIIKQTQGNYDEAINLFAEIGKLAKTNAVSLSMKEQKLYYDIYHYRRQQLLNTIVDSEQYLNKDIPGKMLTLFSTIETIVKDLQTTANEIDAANYRIFWKKVYADKLHFEGYYTGNFADFSPIKKSSENYNENLGPLREMLSDADITLLDACLGFGETRTACNNLGATFDMMACETPKQCLTLGRKATSDDNPDLVPLAKFVDTYCKHGYQTPTILYKYAFFKRE